MKSNANPKQPHLSPVPCIVIHANACGCSGANVVRVNDAYVAELHGAKRSELRLNMPIITDFGACCAPIDDVDVAALSNEAWKQLAPPHTLRQLAVTDGEELVTEAEALTKLKMKRTHFRDLIREGVLPQPMKVGKKKVVWLLCELRQRYAKHLTASR